jgi:hypothetical protein
MAHFRALVLVPPCSEADAASHESAERYLSVTAERYLAPFADRLYVAPYLFPCRCVLLNAENVRPTPLSEGERIHWVRTPVGVRVRKDEVARLLELASTLARRECPGCEGSGTVTCSLNPQRQWDYCSVLTDEATPADRAAPDLVEAVVTPDGDWWDRDSVPEGDWDSRIRTLLTRYRDCLAIPCNVHI